MGIILINFSRIEGASLAMTTLESSLLTAARSSGVERLITGAAIVNESQALILRRAADDFMGGIFEIPGGKVDSNETIATGLIREVKEETGLDVSRVGPYLGYFDYRSGSGKKSRQFNYIVIPASGGVVTLDPKEHSDYRWISLNEINDFNLTFSVKSVLRSAFSFLENGQLTAIDDHTEK